MVAAHTPAHTRQSKIHTSLTKCANTKQTSNRRCNHKDRQTSDQKGTHTSTHTSTQPDDNNMPLRFWKKETDLTQLKARVRRLEASRKNLATLRDVVKHWNDMATGNGMMRRIKAQELWRKETDSVLLEIMKDITIIERKLNGLCPLGSELEAISERATSGSEDSIRTIEQDGSSVPLSPSTVPSTFTKRKGNGLERVALSTDALRLSPPGDNA